MAQSLHDRLDHILDAAFHHTHHLHELPLMDGLGLSMEPQFGRALLQQLPLLLPGVQTRPRVVIEHVDFDQCYRDLLAFPADNDVHDSRV